MIAAEKNDDQLVAGLVARGARDEGPAEVRLLQAVAENRDQDVFLPKEIAQARGRRSPRPGPTARARAHSPATERRRVSGSP